MDTGTSLESQPFISKSEPQSINHHSTSILIYYILISSLDAYNSLQNAGRCTDDQSSVQSGATVHRPWEDVTAYRVSILRTNLPVIVLVQRGA